MKVLADTHILIWYLTGDDRLTEKARKIIDDEKKDIYFSLVSVWEISIKHNRKLESLTLTAQSFVQFCLEQGFLEYPIYRRHIYTLDSLKRETDAPEHHDPFDRLLLSQAKADGLLFLTHDTLIPYYNEPCIYTV